MPAAAGIQPEKLLKELANLWVDLGKADSQNVDAGVLRACAMTLIVAADCDEDAQLAGETLAELIHENPSRAIVLRIDQHAGGSLDSRVFAQCWMPFGRRQQICCEQIEITASADRLVDLPQIVLGLIAPDLPVVLWSRSARISANADFARLFPLADKIIVDSSGFPDPASGLAFIQILRDAKICVADLAWTRLSRWREIVALIFEDHLNRPFLASLARVEISHRGPAVPVAARYLAGWFAQALGRPLETAFAVADSPLDEDVAAIAFSGAGFSASATLETDSFAALRVNDWTSRSPFPKIGEAELLNEEMAILGADPTFLRSIA